MITVTKTLTMPIGHRLLNYEGPCKYIHGHNWKICLSFSVTNEECLNRSGFVIDFGLIKKEIGNLLNALFDHAMLVNPYDTELLEFLQKQKSKYYIMPKRKDMGASNPTAENLALLIHEITRDFAKTHSTTSHTIRAEQVTVFESETAWAEYR